MQPRVIAILVVHNDEPILERSLAALAAQTRAPDDVVLVDAASSDGSPARLAAAFLPVVTVTARSFGSAIGQALSSLPASAEGDWLWLLPGDSIPEPMALAALLAAIEIAPSVAIAGPKLVDPDDRALLRSFGESITRFGAALPLVEDDLGETVGGVLVCPGRSQGFLD